jgi:hypothetical protein
VSCPRPALVLAAAAALALIGAATPADARPKPKPKAPVGEKVRIETEPAGATVYLGDKDSGAAGSTPLDLQLPAGEQVVIIELEGYVPRFETIAIEDRTGDTDGTTQTFAYALDPATGMLVIEAEEGAVMPDGLLVTVDGLDQGTLPAKLEVEVGAHQVQITAPGRAPYEEWVEVAGGEDQVLTIAAASLGAEVVTDKPDKPRKKTKRAGQRMGELRTGVEIGFRRFRYDSPRSANARPYDANGTLHVVVDAELYPWRRFVASRALDRLSITAGAGYSPAIAAHADMGATVNAYWRSQHAGLRFHTQVIEALAIDVDAGWTHTLYTFLTPEGAPVLEAPDVDYHAIEIGARVIGRVDAFRFWLGGDNRLVLSAGELDNRFRGAKVDGVAARAGVAAWFLKDRLEARVEGRYAHYGWTFQPQAGDQFDADGGSDAIYGVTITVGGSY